MPYVVIKGAFYIKGYSPDGDSIRFQADNRAKWAKLSGVPVSLNARGHAQLRLEAINTLETHFKNQHQPLTLAMEALDFLLNGLGVTGIQTDAALTMVTAAAEGTKGYILTRATEKNGRPVAFVYPGAPPESGASLYLTPAMLRTSINYLSLQAGLAYPTYYNGLFHDLRDACTEAVMAARKERRGIWAQDHTNEGFVYDGLPAITEREVILPKLFRRLVEYMEGGGQSLADFVAWLATGREGVLIISQSHFTHLDTLVEVTGQRVKLRERPENLIFME